MLDVGLNTRVFQGGSLRRDFPHVATVFENTNQAAETGNVIADRIVNLGYLNYFDGRLHNFDKLKTSCNNYIGADVNGIDGNADKFIRYTEKGKDQVGYAKDTKIIKGFTPYEFQRTENGGVRRVPVQGAEKANYAVLKRTLADGDTVELTMKQAKNGKYEAVALKSTKGKTLAELPQVKEMLLKLDPLVKRFIKIAR